MLTHLVRNEQSGFMHIVVSLTDEGQFGPEIAAAGATLHCIRLQRGSVSLTGLLRLTQLIRSAKPNIIQTWLYHADLAGLLGRMLAGSTAPVLWNIRCSMMQPDYYSFLMQLILRLLVALSRFPLAIISNSSRAIEEHTALGYQARRWVFIPNGFDVERWHPDPAARNEVRSNWRLPEGAFAFGMIARLDAMKDFGNFLLAASRVAERYPQAHFFLIGKGTRADAAPIAAVLNRTQLLSDRLHCLGQQQNIPRLLPALDCHVLSSAYGEGFPNVLGEAMACGVPCITTDVGDAASVVGEAGFVVPPRDSEALAAAMCRMIELSEKDRRILSETARQRIIERYSLDTVTAQYHDLYRSITASAAETPSPA